MRKRSPDELEEDGGLDDEEPDYATEILGVSAPDVDLEQVGISRDLAIILGPEGTQEVIVGAMLRGIARVLHGAFVNDEVAAGKMKVINAAIDQIQRLSPEEWGEVYRRHISRRDDLMTRLATAQESLAATREARDELEGRADRLQAEMEKLRSQITDSPQVDAIHSLFTSGCSRPKHKLLLNGDNDLAVWETLGCLVITGGHVHYVARPDRVNTNDHSVDPIDELAPSFQAAQYSRKDGDRGVFATESGIQRPRKIMGAYLGETAVESDELGLTPLEECMDILRQTRPEIGIGSRLLIASPTIDIEGKPVGLIFKNYGPIQSIFGPYKVTQAKVTGPHIGGIEK